MLLIQTSKDNDVMILMNVVKESQDVAQIHNVSTLMEATNVHVQEVSLEMLLMDVFKFLECVQMVQFVTEMQCANMLVEIDIGETCDNLMHNKI
jgi:hypothetical protein